MNKIQEMNEEIIPVIDIIKMDDIFMYLFMLEKIYRLTNNLILVKKAEEVHKKNIELDEEIRQLEEELKE
jgi:hypothetical protein